MKYIDPNIFILALIGEERRKSLCNGILSSIANKKFEAITSFLSWDEFVYIIRNHLGRSVAIEQGKRFLSYPGLKLINADEKVVNFAQQLISKYEIGPRDAIHAATALVNNVTKIISDDADFDKIKEIKREKLNS